MYESIFLPQIAIVPYVYMYIYICLQKLGAVIGSPRSEVIDGSESKRVLGTKQVLSTTTSSLLSRNSSF